MTEVVLHELVRTKLYTASYAFAAVFGLDSIKEEL